MKCFYRDIFGHMGPTLVTSSLRVLFQQIKSFLYNVKAHGLFQLRNIPKHTKTGYLPADTSNLKAFRWHIKGLSPAPICSTF